MQQKVTNSGTTVKNRFPSQQTLSVPEKQLRQHQHFCYLHPVGAHNAGGGAVQGAIQ